MKKFRKSLIIISSIALLASSGALFLNSCNSETQVTEKPSIKILNGELIEVNVDEHVSLNVEKKNIKGELFYASSNEDVTIVSSTGTIYGLKEGEATIKVYVNNVFDTVKVVVKNPNSSSPSLEITNGDKLELGISQSKDIEYKLNNCTGEVKVAFSIPGIAETNGYKENAISISGIKKGTTILTLYIDDEIKDSIEITVKELENVPIKISLSKEEVKTGEPLEILVDLAPGYSMDDVQFYPLTGKSSVEIEKTTIHTVLSGYVQIIAMIDGFESNKVGFTIYDFTYQMDSQVALVGKQEKIKLIDYQYDVNCLEPVFSDREIGAVTVENNNELIFTAKKVGETRLFFRDLENGLRSLALTITVVDEDPYKNIGAEEFYKNIILELVTIQMQCIEQNIIL